MPNKLTIPFSIIGFGVFVWYSSATFGGKADKTETHLLREKTAELDKANSNLSLKLDYVIKDTTDANSKLDFIIKEMVRSRDSSSQLPPPPTPSPLSK